MSCSPVGLSSIVKKQNGVQATTFVNNLLVGSRNIDHRGSFHVLNMATNDTFQCSITEPIFSKSRHEVGVQSRFLLHSLLVHMLPLSFPVLISCAELQC
jgi:hypothetical protein